MKNPQLPEELRRFEQSNQTEWTNPTQPAESKTREYLSNERTYLSWMRTAVSLMGISAILGRIATTHPPLAGESAWPLGIIFAVAGLITVFLATQHYLAVRREITSDSGAVTERWIVIFSIAVILIGSSMLYYVLTYTLNNHSVHA